MTGSIIWLIIVAVMVVIEIITLGLTTIWFGIGAVGAAVAAWMGYGIWVQLVVFAVLSVVAMALCRPFAIRYLNRDKEKTNVENVVGKTVVVSKKIDNEMASGEVKLNGIEWTARSEDGRVIPENERVTVTAVEGVKLIVK
ncbi:MAG: NfeD family protein [Acetatifactor sp.]